MVAQCSDNIQAKNGDIPLHIACRAGKVDIIKYLRNTCKCEPSMKLRNSHGRLPVHYACEHSLEIMKLVGQFCTIDDLTRQPFFKGTISALDIACSYGVLNIVDYIFNQKEVSLSGLTNDQRALWHACGLYKVDKDILWNDDHTQNGCAHPALVEYLITKCGCDPSLSCRDRDSFVSFSAVE